MKNNKQVVISSIEQLAKFRGIQKQELNTAMSLNHMTLRGRLRNPLEFTRVESDLLASILKITAADIESLIRGKAIKVNKPVVKWVNTDEDAK